MKRGEGDVKLNEGAADDDLSDKRPPRIRCPRCAWKPQRRDRWQCACLHRWNTFDTRGCCPACGQQWNDTQCLKCHAWSKHKAWYEKRAP